MNGYKKKLGYEGETIVKQWYEEHGYHCQAQNFTIRGGELDLIMTNATHLVVVEVKVVNYIEHLHEYITPRKLATLQKSIQTYLWKYPTEKIVQLDVVFVKQGKIVHMVRQVEV